MKMREDADLIGGRLAALTMNGVMGKRVGTYHMQPVDSPEDADACLIRSIDFCRSQGLLDLLFRFNKPICSFGDERFSCSGREGRSERSSAVRA